MTPRDEPVRARAVEEAELRQALKWMQTERGEVHVTFDRLIEALTSSGFRLATSETQGVSEPLSDSPEPPTPDIEIAITNLRACPCREHRQPISVLERVLKRLAAAPSPGDSGLRPGELDEFDERTADWNPTFRARVRAALRDTP